MKQTREVQASFWQNAAKHYSTSIRKGASGSDGVGVWCQQVLAVSSLHDNTLSNFKFWWWELLVSMETNHLFIVFNTYQINFTLRLRSSWRPYLICWEFFRLHVGHSPGDLRDLGKWVTTRTSVNDCPWQILCLTYTHMTLKEKSFIIKIVIILKPLSQPSSAIALSPQGNIYELWKMHNFILIA